jgi:hypothetical protein
VASNISKSTEQHKTQSKFLYTTREQDLTYTGLSTKVRHYDQNEIVRKMINKTHARTHEISNLIICVCSLDLDLDLDLTLDRLMPSLYCALHRNGNTRMKLNSLYSRRSIRICLVFYLPSIDAVI